MHTHMWPAYMYYSYLVKTNSNCSIQNKPNTYKSTERLFRHIMLSGELDHAYLLECCLGETDKDYFHKYGYCKNYNHLQMLHIY